MATTKKQTAKKECIVIARYAFKTNGKMNGHICTLVRNGEGIEHKVWTHNNGCASSCDCECFEKSHGRRKCYHVTQIEAREEARKQSAIVTQPEVSAQPVLDDEPAIIGSVADYITTEYQGLDDVILTSEEEAESRRIREANKAAEAAAIARFVEESKRRTSAPLNGNQGFSLLKKSA